jgi:hypothetical protein
VTAVSRRIDANSIQLSSLFENDLDFNSPISAENLQRLKGFLQNNDLKRHLREGKENLGKIKAFIEKNFSTVELMIDVGSEQLKKKIRW